MFKHILIHVDFVPFSDVNLNKVANNAQFGKSSLELLPATYCPEDVMDIAGCVKGSKVNWTRNSYPSYSTNIRCSK